MLERIHHEPPKIEVSDLSLLKAATRAAIRAAGPIATVSCDTRLDGGTLSRAGNVNETNFLPIDDAVRIDAMTGDCRIIRAMARLLGYRLVPVGTENGPSSLINDASEMARESGELVADALEADADGKITATEARLVDDQAADVEDCVQSIRKKLHTVIAP